MAHEVLEGSNHGLRQLPDSDMGCDRREGFRKEQAVRLLPGHWSDRDCMLVQMNSFGHNHAAEFQARGPNTHGPRAEAWCERRLPGPAAATPRRTPRFRARSVAAAALESLDEGDGGFVVREQFDVETIGGALLAAVQVLRLLDGVGSRSGVAKQNPMDLYHPGICDSNYPPRPSPNIRLFRGCRLLM